VTASTLSRPFHPVFSHADKRRRIIAVPNLSRSFSVMAASVLRSLGYRATALPLADLQAFQLAKRFVHNDMCFPVQANIGEFLRYLSSGELPAKEVAVILAKNCEDCRAGQYAAIARKALDDAGYSETAIITTGADAKRIHPGFRAGNRYTLKMLWGGAITDALDAMVHATRPYECETGSVDSVYEHHLEQITQALEKSPRRALSALAEAVRHFNNIDIVRTIPRPRVFITGEILMNYHETANRQLIRYLEKNGMEALVPDIVTFFWRQAVVIRDASLRKLVHMPGIRLIYAKLMDMVYRHVLGAVDRVYVHFRYYTPHADIEELAGLVDGLVDKAIIAGEGWLIPAEIMYHAVRGVTSFIIIQPFGCLPNQITGRGLVKALKERFPHINILCLDYDSDVSMANIENRLQMLLMATKESARST
jgi:predicted nucleotide-binding protein (sugar kinase/HSP70/actin superfamily)